MSNAFLYVVVKVDLIDLKDEEELVEKVIRIDSI